MTTQSEQRLDGELKSAFRSAVDEAELSIDVAARLSDFTNAPAKQRFGWLRSLGFDGPRSIAVGGTAATCAIITVVGVTYFVANNPASDFSNSQEISAGQQGGAEVPGDSENLQGRSENGKGNLDQTDFSGPEGDSSDEPSNGDSTDQNSTGSATASNGRATNSGATEPEMDGGDAVDELAPADDPIKQDELGSESSPPVSSSSIPSGPNVEGVPVASGRSGSTDTDDSADQGRSTPTTSQSSSPTQRTLTTAAGRATTASSPTTEGLAARRRPTSTQRTTRVPTTDAELFSPETRPSSSSTSSSIVSATTTTVREPAQTTTEQTTTSEVTTTTTTTQPEATTCSFSIDGGSLSEATATLRNAGCTGSILLVPANASGSLAYVAGGSSQTVDKSASITLVGYSNVPDVEGISSSAATSLLESASFTPIANSLFVPADDPRIGTVITQTPRAQTRQQALSVVRYTVAVAEPVG